MKPPINTVVFDLDGTLVDSAPDIQATLDGILSAHGLRSTSLAEVRSWMGEGAQTLVERAIRATGGSDRGLSVPGFLGLFLERYESRPAQATRVYPHVRQTLDILLKRGYKLGICTNKPLAHTLRVLEALELAPCFSSVVAGDSLPRRKPDPMPLLRCLDEMGRSPLDAVMVGDSKVDLDAADAAGMPAFLVSWGYSRVPVDGLGAAAVLHSFLELPSKLTWSSHSARSPGS